MENVEFVTIDNVDFEKEIDSWVKKYDCSKTSALATVLGRYADGYQGQFHTGDKLIFVAYTPFGWVFRMAK